MAMATGKSVPKAFLLKKKKLIQELSIPDEAYSDLSPKGSVDANIRELIDEVNAIEGLVTTSSCGGRISVFLEGKHTTSSDAAEVNDTSEGFRAVVPGGKGAGGRWLFVSHDPMLSENIDMTNVMDLFGISPPGSKKLSFAPSLCFIKLQFEPMILHIMAASLHHAQHVLSAAIGAGFRESGVQSLKNLDDPNALPMVAVRTAGLAFSTVIGYMSGSSQVGLVEEEQLKLLLKVANERFVANADRIARFRERLLHSRSSHPPGWEEESTRRERKRAEGLKMRDQQRLQRASRENVVAETDLIRNSSVENLEMFA